MGWDKGLSVKYDIDGPPSSFRDYYNVTLYLILYYTKLFVEMAVSQNRNKTKENETDFYFQLPSNKWRAQS